MKKPAPVCLRVNFSPVAATINAARVMNEEKDYGSILPGKVADLVIVNGRPVSESLTSRTLRR